MVRISREESEQFSLQWVQGILETASSCHRFDLLCLAFLTHLLYVAAVVSLPKQRTRYHVTLKHRTVPHSFPDMSFFSLFLFPQHYHAQERAHLAPCYRISIDAFSPQTSSSRTVCSERGSCTMLAQRPLNVLLRQISLSGLSLSDFSLELFS